MRQLWPRSQIHYERNEESQLLSHVFHQPFGFPSEQCRESQINVDDELF